MTRSFGPNESNGGRRMPGCLAGCKAGAHHPDRRPGSLIRGNAAADHEQPVHPNGFRDRDGLAAGLWSPESAAEDLAGADLRNPLSDQRRQGRRGREIRFR